MNWDNARVLVVGDVMLDRWIYMKKTRISPEAPIPIVEEQEYFAELGGAGNALRHLNNLSRADHFLIGMRGPDTVGDEMTSLKGLNAGQMDLVIDPSRRTTVKERVYIDGEPIFRKDSEDVTSLNQETEAEIVREVSNRIENCEVLLLSDYAKGLLTETLIASLLSLAKARKKPVVSDPGLGRVAFFAGCDVIKPNAKEWQEFVQNHRDEAEALAWLFSRGTKCVVVTHGKNGITYFSAGQSVVAAPADEIDAVDVTGAGDSVAAIVSLVVGSGKELVDYLDMLNQVGGLTVAQSRTSLPKI
ncbi:MAG: PfkB family carbohydrate kinase [Candidatus Nanopelagicaceae bacterium]|nr:PfkB family carbohydrate kinase [Candidatus Nanopelagicaceae bacterium]